MIKKKYMIIATLLFTIFLLLFLVLPISLVYIVSSKDAHVKGSYVSPNEVKNAVHTFNYIKSELFDTENEVDLRLKEEDMVVLFKTTSKAMPWFDFDFGMDSNFLIFSGTLDISKVFESRYINVSCLIIPDRYNSIDNCKFGSITIPGNIVRWIASTIINIFFDKSINEVFLQIISNVSIESKVVNISAFKNVDFKEKSKDGILAMLSTAKVFRYNKSYTLDPEIISNYIYYILDDKKIIDNDEISLSTVFSVAFSYASQRSKFSEPVKENEYAIWSIAIAFVNPRFSELLKIEIDALKKLPGSFFSKSLVLNGRRDLALHFIYSAILEGVGNEEFSTNIGEIKELLDANKGGTGFDISDLAAGISGAKFSNFILSSENNARMSQKLLASSSSSEELFFPNIARYPGAINAADFEDLIGYSNNKILSDFVTKLQHDVRNLSLYQQDPPYEKINETAVGILNQIPWAQQGVWLSSDTHIHTSHSDGAHSIIEVAVKAQEYGCDAIAITDHADGDLKAGSLEYFLEIESINRLNPNLSVISGLEWNLPPYKGQEHASILFPDSGKTALTASKFREMFDDYNNSINPFVSVIDALMWLENAYLDSPVLPVVFYNHPSRKANDTGEVHRNLMDWAEDNPIFVGFSGAPGHQRMPAERIGSYAHKLRTSDRWDPIVAEVGGVWDTLLGKGNVLWGARSPSDFHGTRGDYWPCQFSETKVYARENSINGVVEALRKGSFFGSHGKVIKDLRFKLEAASLIRPVIMGETAVVPEGSSLVISLDIELNEQNWKGAPAKLEQVELIVVSDGQATSKVYDAEYYRRGNKVRIAVSNLIVVSDMALRFRGRSMQAINGDYMFYTNPIMVRAISTSN